MSTEYRNGAAEVHCDADFCEHVVEEDSRVKTIQGLDNKALNNGWAVGMRHGGEVVHYCPDHTKEANQ